MKNINNTKLMVLICIVLGITSCKSQTVYSLNNSEIDTPTNSYFKDLNNELDFYVGTWIATYQNKKITLVITKDLKRPFEMLNKSFYKDVLLLKFEVKNGNTNQTLQSTLNTNFGIGGEIKYLMMSAGTNIRGNNELDVVYAGGNCGVGNGEILLKSISNTQFYWSYYSDVSVLTDHKCPPNLDYTIYLPETENLVFTKQ